MIVNWKNYVDHIYIITCTKYKDRAPELYKELSRVDIDVKDKKFITVVQNIDTPLYDALKEYFTFQKMHEEPKSLFISTLMHYYCMKHAVAYEYEKIMIIEDDARFLNNVELIDDFLNEAFNKANIFQDENCGKILLCNSTIAIPVYHNNEDPTKSPYDNTKIFYINHLKYMLRSSGCNIYNTKAMEHFINFIESFKFAPSDVYEQIYDDTIKIYCLSKPICLQAEWYKIMYNTFEEYNMIYPSEEVLEEIRKSKPFGYRDGERIYQSIIKYKNKKK